MLGKLIKYDMRSQRRILLPLTLAILAASLLCTVALRFLITAIADDTTGFTTMMFAASTGVFVFLNAIAILVYPTVTLILVMVHYYRNLYTDEGYLTFTLPVKTSQILASKFITAVIWSTISSVVVIICAGIIILFGTTTEGIINLDVINGFGEVVSWLFDWIGWSIAGLYALNAVSGSLYVIAILFLSITIGSIAAKKHKVLASIGIYYLFNLVTSIIMNIISVIMMFTALAGDIDTSFTFTTTFTPLINSIIYLGFGAAAVVACRHLMRNNLNLP